MLTGRQASGFEDSGTRLNIPVDGDPVGFSGEVGILCEAFEKNVDEIVTAIC